MTHYTTLVQRCRSSNSLLADEIDAEFRRIEREIWTAKAEERERCARILDNEAAKWVESKKQLRPLDEVPAAHDRFWNYIENAKRLAIAIRSAEGDGNNG